MKQKKEQSYIHELFEVYLKEKGLKMSKKLTSAHYGLFSHSEATYDRRIVYSPKDLLLLIKEGFSVEEDEGNWMFNMIWTTLTIK